MFNNFYPTDQNSYLKISLFDSFGLKNFNLPKNTYGNTWISDFENANLINIEAENNNWVLKGNLEFNIVDGNRYLTSVILEPYHFYTIQNVHTKKVYYLYCSYQYESSFYQLKLKNTELEFYIGNNNQTSNESNANAISYKHPSFVHNQLKIIVSNSMVHITNLNTNQYMYVNQVRTDSVILHPGDSVFILGLKFLFAGNVFIINNPLSLVTVNEQYFEHRNIKLLEYQGNNELNDDSIELYEKEDYFLRPPRFKTSIEKKVIAIDPPPTKLENEEMPFIYTMGPMFMMGITSMSTGVFALIKVLNKEQTLTDALPSLIVCLSMLGGMIVFPMLSKRWQKKQRIKKEKERQKKYRAYIDSKRNEIHLEIQNQQNILIENNLPLKECANIILKRRRNLWERKLEQDDFLNLRLGLGTVPPFIDIKYPEEHFSMDGDDLKDILKELVMESKDMENVPITVSFTDKRISAIVGEENATKNMLKGLLLQMIAYHSYDLLKIVIFTSPSKKKNWESLRKIPYCWQNDKSIRFVGTNLDEITKISSYLQEIFESRKTVNGNNTDNKSYQSFPPYYVIITDDFDMVRNVGIIDDVLKQETNLGFSLIINSDNLNNLPNECSEFINLDKNESTLFENELISSKQSSFMPDILDFDVEPCYLKICNVPIDLANGKYILPNSLSFLEMYDVGRVEQLNSYNRWKTSNPITTLQAPVGINENGELFFLDIHEKAHGPHGLVAGMTGSGKSEFLISYILSMAVVYHPYEVNFVLIDYKGGGLAGAFENKVTGVKLPHLAGTITNLDTVEMKRSLASIESELKRRQKIFNEARDHLGESTVDIYKYQQLFRDGKVKEPVPHLIIVSDEFAELKMQQPEFMEQLISTARIGRSLGVHLILATQKPSGIVDDQIWSNSKFRICLKVQEKADSMDMIKCPDAALLKNVGRFYLQVGYNEYFAKGQSAWCGAQYYEMDKRKKNIDNSLDFMTNIGQVYKKVEFEKQKDFGIYKGEELPSILNYVIKIAEKEGAFAKQLWLDSIPEFIYVDELKEKYGYQKMPYIMNPVIGEYDMPSKQKQGILTLPLTEEGNTLIYGAVGSGKDILLNTIMYSLIMDHTADEVNIYALDFGAETLRIFKDAPQVGDVIISSEQEKIENLFKLLNREIEVRKKLFLDYNGDYRFFCNHSNEKVPTILVIINHIEAFQELYEGYEDTLQQIIRDGAKFGIVFVVTTNGVNNIRYKLVQNFKQVLTLQLNDNFDYNNAIGNVGGTYPSKIKGRGLVRLDDVYEFQTAYPYKKEAMSEYIKIICKRLLEMAKTKAKRIPILPEVVDYHEVIEEIGLNHLPIGINKETLDMSYLDLEKQFGMLVTMQDLTDGKLFLTNFASVLTSLKKNRTFILDANAILSNKYEYYYRNNFEQIMDFFIQYCEKIKENNISIQNQELICMIIGIERFKNDLSSEGMTKFETLLNTYKSLGVIKFILVDTIDQIKNIEYDPYYKTLINNTNGIWVGNGIADQFTLKLAKTPRELYEKIDEDFGYFVKNGQATLIKLLNQGKVGEENE